MHPVKMICIDRPLVLAPQRHIEYGPLRATAKIEPRVITGDSHVLGDFRAAQ